MFEYPALIQEVRNELSCNGWALYLYKSRRLKGPKCQGLCNEDAKRISVATGGCPKKEIMWVVAHELGHVYQLQSYSKKDQAFINKSYWVYLDIQEGRPVIADRLFKARKDVLRYEWQAEQLGYQWLNDRGVDVKGFKQDANAYQIQIKCVFQTGKWPKIKKSNIKEKFNLGDTWQSNKAREKFLTDDELDILKGKRSSSVAD